MKDNLFKPGHIRAFNGIQVTLDNLCCILCGLGKDHTIQQRLQPNFSSSHQETPMKPSQVPNRLSQPPPRRILPLQSPELCHRDRLGSPWLPSHTLGPFQSSGFVPSSPTSIGRPHHTPRDRLGPPQHSAQPQFFPISPTKIDTSVNRSQHSPPWIFHHTSPQSMKNLSNHSPSSHMRRDQVTESKVILSHSWSKTVTAKSQESNKVLLSYYSLTINYPVYDLY